MKRHSLLLILFFASFTLLYSQAVGEWRVHLAYHNATKSIPVNNLVYVLSDGSLYSYDTDDTAITTYDKAGCLNDNDIADIVYCDPLNTLLIVYRNSNIDLLINDKDVYNISDFMNKTMMEDKTLNNIYLHDEYAYLSTNFGIVIVNLKKKEITNTYNLGKAVNNSLLKDNMIYAATKEGIYVGDRKDNLLDKSNWKLFDPNVFDDLILFDNTFFGFIKTMGTYKYEEATRSFDPFTIGHYTFINSSNGKFIIGNPETIHVFSSVSSQIIIKQNEQFANLSYSKNDTYWGSNGENGLNQYKYNSNNNQFDVLAKTIIPNSPKRNLFYRLYHTDRLLTCGGGIMYDRFYYKGTVMELKEGTWHNYEEGNTISQQTGFPYQDITSVAQDPRNSNHIYATSAGEGVYEFLDGKFIKLHNIENSILESIYPDHPTGKYNYVRVSGAKYDKSNNLWILNSKVGSSIKVLKSDDTWFKFTHSDFANMETLGDIMFDKRGWAWINSVKQDASIFCLNTNNTLEDTSDDKHVHIQSFINQDGKSLAIYNIFCMVEDKNGAIWIGTDHGPLLINNPTRVFENNFYFTQVKVPRNDGTNNADLLLENETIRAICVDGANRKWIATENSGVYLLSEDGLETIHHFTSDNSPLISNYVFSIAINPENGIVYFGTDKGLVSYRSDATEPGSIFSEDAHAFPNPVYSYYDGVITVTGLLRDSDVKIIDTAGNLIYTGTSTGGQFTWDGKNRNGARVASGVYFVLAANAEGKEGVATKILMLK